MFVANEQVGKRRDVSESFDLSCKNKFYEYLFIFPKSNIKVFCCSFITDSHSFIYFPLDPSLGYKNKNLK